MTYCKLDAVLPYSLASEEEKTDKDVTRFHGNRREIDYVNTIGSDILPPEGTKLCLRQEIEFGSKVKRVAADLVSKSLAC